MLLNLTDLSDEPLQSQIVRQVRANILVGELGADSHLPSIRAMAREQRVSVITVQRAYEALMREGLINSRRGKGFFVAHISEQNKVEMSRVRLRENLSPLIDSALAEGMTAQEIKAAIDEILEEEQSRG